jgi:hypothetical protein
MGPNDSGARAWPDDADGDVFRRLLADGFDFGLPHAIDFNVDFRSWPAPGDALGWLEREYGPVHVIAPEEDLEGYVQFQVQAPVSYELVTAIQQRVSVAMAPYGGTCESWGVLQSPPA